MYISRRERIGIDKKDAEKIKSIIDDRKDAHKLLLEKNSEVYKSFLDLKQKTFSDGSFTKKYKELIAVGISLVINCESYLEWHIGKSLESGASEDQVLETVEVGMEMGGGPASASSRFVLKILEYYGQKDS